MKREFKLREDEHHQWLEHRDYIGNIVKHYYVELDEAILENMPQKMLEDVFVKVDYEIKRREHEKNNH